MKRVTFAFLGALLSTAAVADGPIGGISIPSTPVVYAAQRLKCDGSTDDSAEFIATSAAAAGGTLVLPAGTCIVDNITLSANVVYRGHGDSQTILRRKPNSLANAMITLTGTSHWADLTFDGNKANQTVAANTVVYSGSASEFARVSFINAKGSGGSYGSGAVLSNTSDGASSKQTRFVDTQFRNNDGDGFHAAVASNIIVRGGGAYNNGGAGYSISNNVYPPVAESNVAILIDGVTATINSEGISVGGYSTGGSYAQPIYGNFPTNRNIRVINSTATYNTKYGITLQAYDSVVDNNYVAFNGGDSTNGGILANCAFCTISNNRMTANSGYGVDAGGSYFSQIRNNQFQSQGVVLSIPATDINVGASSQVLIEGNQTSGMWSGGKFITSPGLDGGLFGAFDTLTSAITIRNNKLTARDGTNIGISIGETTDQVVIEGNEAWGYGPNNAFVFMSAGSSDHMTISQRGNIDWTNAGLEPALASTATATIPDAGDEFIVTGTSAINSIVTYRQSVYLNHALSVYMTTQGSGYAPNTNLTPTFSGGTCSSLPVATAAAGATGAFSSSSGKIVGVRFTNLGTCTVAPTITFPAPASGVTATGVVRFEAWNNTNRIIRLRFTGAATVTAAGNIKLNGGTTFTGSNGAVLTLQGNGAGGGWREVSRSQ